MAGFPMNHFYRSSALSIDTHAQNYFEDEEGSILDDNILEQGALDSGLEMSPPINGGSRRDSFAVSSSMFSPKTEDWQHVDMRPMGSNNPFLDQSHNPFLRLDAPQNSYAPQTHGWSMNNASGACTPMQHDGLHAEYDVNTAVFQRPMQAQTPFSNVNNQQMPLFTPANNNSNNNGNSNNASIPASPQKDWPIQDALDPRAMPTRMGRRSPTLRSHPEMTRRGDGIRKKNARFEIPAERNLTNIDQLIAASTDEQEIKELKQQKRLLRNRQAALDSRQRKKQHTERLEDEKKHYTALINELEEELAEAKLALDEWSRKEQQYQQYIESMQLEKEEMVRAHTLETGDLRKKVSVLTEHMQKMESTAMSAMPSSNGFTADYSDIDTLTMNDAWDSITFLDYPLENEVKVENAIVPAKKAENAMLADTEKPAAAQGLLLMLLLFGAFVASKGASPSIPRMSDDVRAASATLLEDIFKDAGVPQTTTSIVEASTPMPSGSSSSWSMMPSGTVGGGDVVGVGSSTLAALTDSLTHPSEEQNHEQVFSLSATQYDSVTSQDFLQTKHSPSTSTGRRNLAETLAAMRLNSKKSAAEVYTRSLLWDQVPTEVVRNFAKLVSECNTRNDHGVPIECS
ncbi:hypothetical protein B7463_g10483, partial [Scytalidium lignicola]